MLYYAKQGTNGKCLMEGCEFMKTECPFCNQHYEVEDELIDKVVECPKCKAEFCVQPLSEEQIIIPPPQIKLAPLFLNKSTSDFPDHNKSDEKLFDSTEDKFVLQGFKSLKRVNLIFTITSVFLLFISAIVCFRQNSLGTGILCLLVTIPVMYHYCIMNIALSWFRGIYRNIMWFSFSQTMPSAKLKK
jgi:hypothetical protein